MGGFREELPETLSERGRPSQNPPDFPHHPPQIPVLSQSFLRGGWSQTFDARDWGGWAYNFGVGGTLIGWVYDDAGKRDPNTGTRLDDIVLEFNDADGDGTGLATLTTRYLHGPQFDQVLASEATSGNVVTWALADHQGTVRDMVRYASGTTTVVNHRKFDAFGNVTAESDSTIKFLFSYTGREWDGDAGLYYYRARWYDAKTGRFISEDPAGFRAGDTNLFRYVGNSSVNGTDPTGLDEIVSIPLSPLYANPQLQYYPLSGYPVLPTSTIQPQPHLTLVQHTFSAAAIVGLVWNVGHSTQPGSAGSSSFVELPNGAISQILLNAQQTPGGACNSCPNGDGGTVNVSLVDVLPGTYRVNIDVTITSNVSTNRPNLTDGGYVTITVPSNTSMPSTPVGATLDPGGNLPLILPLGSFQQTYSYIIDVTVGPTSTANVMTVTPTLSFPSVPPGGNSSVGLTMELAMRAIQRMD